MLTAGGSGGCFPPVPGRREAAQRLPSLGFRSPSPRAGAAFDNCKDNRKSVTTRNREAVARRGGSRAGTPGGPGPVAAPGRGRRTPGGRGRPEAQPLPAGRPGGHRGAFCSPVPGAAERGTGGTARPGDGAGKAVCRARETPQRERRVPGELLPVTAGKHPEQTRARPREVTGRPAATADTTGRPGHRFSP